MSQTHNTYNYPAKLSSTDYRSLPEKQSKSMSVTRESSERLRRDAEKEEEQHLVMQIVVQSFVREHRCLSQRHEDEVAKRLISSGRSSNLNSHSVMSQ